MTDNELIAEWLDWKLGENTLLRWNDCITCGKPLGERFVVFSPETDINLWHGEDGIFKQVENSLLVVSFMLRLGDMLNVPSEDLMLGWAVWRLMIATPAQLTAALVAVIKEE